ncbi:MAG TPA: hypothetical protein PLZ57_11100 [Pseudobdellovibrionaceae bacterium]|nr:hypothetical protein [Pseudobdellovibrionaceae bacterium]
MLGRIGSRSRSFAAHADPASAKAFAVRSRSRTRILSQQRGSMLVATMVAAAVVVAIAVGIGHWVDNNIKLNQSIVARNRAVLAHAKLLGTIQNNEAWKATISANGGEFSCLSSNNCPMTERDFRLYGSDSALVYDPAPAANGFRWSGETCAEFNATLGSNVCPFRYELKWIPSCASGPSCKQKPRVIARLRFRSPDPIVLNVENYSIDLIRGEYLASLEDNCAKMGGQIDQDTGKCLLPIQRDTTELGCPVGKFLNGIDPTTGEMRCQPIAAVTSPCPAGSGIQRIQPNGNIQCAAP